MNKHKSIDFSKLLGFDQISDRLNEQVDFSAAAIGTALGAKVGEPQAHFDFRSSVLSAKLGAKLGEPTAIVDFRSSSISAKIGAKIGEPG